MSPFFVKKFKKENRCAKCATYQAEKGKVLCSQHAKVARLAWVVWSALRQRAGYCIECPRGTDRKNCRCAEHRERNRKRCASWAITQVAANPNFVGDRFRMVRDRYAAEGKCLCSGHPPLLAGHARCAGCVLRHKVSAKKATKAEQVEWRRQRRTKISARTEAKQEKVAQARRELVELGFAPVRQTSRSKDRWSVRVHVVG